MNKLSFFAEYYFIKHTNIGTIYNEYLTEIIYKSYFKSQAGRLGLRDLKFYEKKSVERKSLGEGAALLV